VRFAWIEEHRATWPVAVQCAVLDVSRSGFYAWRERPLSGQSQRRELLLEEIQAIHHERRKDVYGSPRIHQELTARGRRCNVKTVARIMKERGIRAKTARTFKVTTDSKHDRPVAPNVLDRAFEQTAPNQAWVSDITYVPTREGWLYLAAVEDLCTRKIVGWSMSERLTSRLVVDALEMAIQRQLPGEGLLSHSDRGSQYASEHYQELLKRYGIKCSMSRRGDCWDNAPMESFFATLKKELVHFEDYATRDAARESLFEYIELFYNRVRRHSALGYKSPAEFEQVA
jgi:transposase InsO family protein